MQYIRKQNTPPPDWGDWFTTANGRRSFDYGIDENDLSRKSEAKDYLLEEQHFLCAYCQQKLTSDTASIEHVIPKEFNKELSTNYYNLVAVCKNPPKDQHNRSHCDKAKGSLLITPLIFSSAADIDIENRQSNRYFISHADGSIEVKNNLPDPIRKQVEAFIEVLNLNHGKLKDKRKDALLSITKAYQAISTSSHQKNGFLPNKLRQIALNPKEPFRQFLLIYLASKTGIN